MKILFLCHRFPYPPDGGAKIRPFAMIKHLHREHEVVVGSLVRNDAEEQGAPGLAEHCTRFFHARIGKFAAMARMLLRLPTPTPSSMGYFHSPDLHRWVQRELATGGYDLLVVHCSSMAPYVLGVPGAGSVPKILDFTDMDSQKWLTYAPVRPWPLSWGYRLEGSKLVRAEKKYAQQFDLSTVATRLERKSLDDFGTDARSDWFPNGVDSEYFSPASEPADPDTICFLGRMNYYPNRECMVRFADEVMPVLLKRRPTTKLLIVGAEPPADVVALGERPGITVTGSVPDVRPFLHKAAVSIAPLVIARGTQNKILEALAAGVPVVCSRLAASGVDAVVGEHLLVGDTPDEQADAILSLLDDPEYRERMAKAGRERMLSHHSWEHAMERFDELIHSCVRQKAEPAREPAHQG